MAILAIFDKNGTDIEGRSGIMINEDNMEGRVGCNRLKFFLEGGVPVVLIFALVGCFLFIVFRNMGLYPIVFSDELSYSKFSRLAPLESASLPNYLYFKLFSLTNLCGDSFLQCSRVVNDIFYFASAPFIYLIARTVASFKVSLGVMVLALCGAGNSYTAYFMPESMYFFSFWLLSWSVLRIDARSSFIDFCMIGILVGGASLVKPHALFILPAICSYVIIFFGRANVTWQYFKWPLLIIMSAVFVKLGVGWGLAGKAGVTFFGTLYAPIADSAMSSGFSHYLKIIRYTAFSLWGNFAALCFLYSVPVAVTCVALCSVLGNRRDNNSKSGLLSVYSLLVVASLVFVTALFTASIADTSPGNHLHTRYYFFALPLFMLVAAAGVTHRVRVSPFIKWIVTVLVGLAVAYSIITRLSTYEVYSSTAPELYGVFVSGVMFNVVGGLSLLSLAVWVSSPARGSKIFLIFVMPVITITSSYFVNEALNQRLKPDAYDAAGMFVRSFVKQDDRASILIVGDEGGIGGLFRTLYYLDLKDLNYLDIHRTDSSILAMKPDDSLDLSSVSADKRWVLIIGSRPVSGERLGTIKGPGFEFINVH